MQFLNRLGVVSEILLATNEDDGETLAEMQDFGDPLKIPCQQMEQPFDYVSSIVPSPERCPMNPASRLQSR